MESYAVTQYSAGDGYVINGLDMGVCADTCRREAPSAGAAGPSPAPCFSVRAAILSRHLDGSKKSHGVALLEIVTCAHVRLFITLKIFRHPTPSRSLLRKKGFAGIMSDGL